MERPELYHEYNPKVKWKMMPCPRCLARGRFCFRWCCQHHVDRKRNSNRVAWVCSNKNPEEIIYENACHQWIHGNPDLAEEEGYYNKLKGGYMKKPSKKNKWEIKKKESSPSKWKLNK